MNPSREPPTRRNPMAPSSEERTAICSLIEGDKSLIDALSDERAKREVIVQQNESKAAIAASCLYALNADLARATRFRDIIVETLENIELFEGDGTEKAPVSQSTLNAGHLPPDPAVHMPVSRITSKYHGTTVEALMEIKAAIEMATSTAHRYRQELDTANSLISLTRADIRRITDQINECSDAIVAKKFSLQAIWRVPDEIWGLIFQHSTGTANGSVASNDDWIRSDISWHAALVISAVCQRWRSIAHVLPRLWANITVFRGGWRFHNLSRVRWYVERAGNSAKTLLVGAPLVVSANRIQELRAVMGQCSSVERIICKLGKENANTALRAILTCLPLAPNLWLLRNQQQTEASLESAPYYSILIPDALTMRVEHLVTESIYLMWGAVSQASPRLRSCTIASPSIYSGSNEGALFGPTIGRFIATSLPTLKDLRLHMPQLSWHPEHVTEVTANALETLHLDLQSLLVQFSPRYKMPSLKNLVLIGGLDVTMAEYELSKARPSFATIQSLTIESMTNVGPLPALILDSIDLSSLELRGDSVDATLSSLVEASYDKECGFLASLRRLTIASYAGDGGIVYDFLRTWKMSHSRNPRSLELILFTDECLSITLETRKQIYSLAGAE